MSYIKNEYTFKSNNGIDIIHYYVYTPQEKPRALLQLSHGMCEYVSRYDHLAEFMTDNGIIVFGNDHLGHGKSARDDNHLGYFGKKNGWKHLSKDLHTLTLEMKKQYPDLPCYLLGHSMGSFIVRDYISKYSNDISGAILCGTSGGNPLSPVGIFLATFLKTVKGELHRSSFLSDLAFKDYNRKFSDVASVHDWISKDREIVSKYDADKHCNFYFTASGFADLTKLLDSVSQNEWYRKVPSDLPVYLIAGDMDPVGAYGKGVEKVYRKLKKKGLKDISIKLYRNDRHEIFNETDKDVVMNDTLEWINSHIKKLKKS